MAGLRNLAIGALRLIGRTDITDATRWAGRFMHRPFTILNITGCINPAHPQQKIERHTLGAPTRTVRSLPARSMIAPMNANMIRAVRVNA
jgi:hypothetical protein